MYRNDTQDPNQELNENRNDHNHEDYLFEMHNMHNCPCMQCYPMMYGQHMVPNQSIPNQTIPNQIPAQIMPYDAANDEDNIMMHRQRPYYYPRPYPRPYYPYYPYFYPYFYPFYWYYRPW